MTAEATIARFREYMLGPSRFMNLLSCFELGIIDALQKNSGLTAAQIGDAVGAPPDEVEQLLHLLVKEDFVACDESSGAYSLDRLADITAAERQRLLALMNLVKVLVLRQAFYLTDSVRAGRPVGLSKLYGFDGNLYGAVAEHQDLRDSWAPLMDAVTAHIDPWFFDNVEIPPGARVLDVAGNTGLGAILTHMLKGSSGLRVTTFDLPEKEGECLENFQAHGVQEFCSFIGGDVFEEVPKGFDVILIKHFLDMFDKRDVFRIFRGVNKSLNIGGQVNILVPVYPEDVRDSCSVDFFPTFFIGCTMGQGGPQKLSTYRDWLEECGFKVTKATAQDPAKIPPESWVVHGILCATKVA